ncbi:MAG: hypothetical protein ABUS54_11960 [Actinomycetota bacterium]
MNGRRLALLLAPVAAVAAGCGGGHGSPGVAGLGTTAAMTTTSTGSSATGDKQSSALAFSQCMRRNGVPGFPDPSEGGGLRISAGSGVDPDSPQFKAAQSKCGKLLPNGGRPSQAQIQKAEASALAFSRCMRAHGVPDFPDPQFDTSGPGFGIKIGGKGNGLDPSSPIFQAAQRACQKDLPGGLKGRGPAVVTGSGK